MYLQIRDLKKSYGEGGSDVQVSIPRLKKDRCVSFREPVVPVNLPC